MVWHDPTHVVSACALRSRKLNRVQQIFSIPGLFRQACGRAHTAVQDHIFGITRTILFEAGCEGGNASDAPPFVAFRFGGKVDLAAFTKNTHDYTQAQKQFGLERLNAGDSLIVGEYEREIVFYAWLMYGKADLDQRAFVPLLPNIAYSYRVFTVRRARGLRICSAYYRHVGNLLWQQGYHRMICRIAPGNEASIRAHKRVGFQPHGLLWKLMIAGHAFFYADPVSRAWWPTVATAVSFGRYGVLRQTADEPLTLGV